MTRYERADGLNIGNTSLLYGYTQDMTSLQLEGTISTIIFCYSTCTLHFFSPESMHGIEL